MVLMMVRLTGDEQRAVEALVTGLRAMNKAAALLGVSDTSTLDRAFGFGTGRVRGVTAEVIRGRLRRLLQASPELFAWRTGDTDIPGRLLGEHAA